jgi:hypothetical protein
MDDWIGRDAQAAPRIDSGEQRREHAQGVLPKLVRVVVDVAALAAVLDLKASLVGWPVPRRRSRCQEGVGNDPHPLTRGSLERNDERRAIRRGAVDDLAPGRKQRTRHVVDERTASLGVD